MWEGCRGGVLDVISGGALTSRVIVIGIDGWLSSRQRATGLGESGRGLALGCYFQLQQTRAELTAKAFVHPMRKRRRRRVRVCVRRAGWAVESGREGQGKQEANREGGGGVSLACAAEFDVETLL